MSSSTIHWFPGHMATARSEIRKAMPGVDLVIEILDARIPFSSENPLVAELRGTKPCIQILNKADLADPAVTAESSAFVTRSPSLTFDPMAVTVLQYGEMATRTRRPA
jgi:ribosome biogenesis GTPase A